MLLENDIEKAKSLKCLLLCYELMTGMKINYDKSDMLTIGLEEYVGNDLANIFCCKRGSFPIKYLGVPLHSAKLRRSKGFATGNW